MLLVCVFVYTVMDARLMLLICWVLQHVILRVLPSNLIIYPKAGTLLDPATSIFLFKLHNYPKVSAQFLYYHSAGNIRLKKRIDELKIF